MSKENMERQLSAPVSVSTAPAADDPTFSLSASVRIFRSSCTELLRASAAWVRLSCGHTHCMRLHVSCHGARTGLPTSLTQEN